MESENFRHKKSLGQNFLVDRNILRFIVERASPGAEDVVLEIGPGKGVLTREILASSCSLLYSVEIDRALEPFLSGIEALHPRRFRLIWGDAMEAAYSSFSPPPGKVIANIPYNITTPLIWRLLEELPSVRYYLLMVQKEAAERITAPSGTKSRYPLGITLELMGKASTVRNVPREVFRPVPGVDSCLLEILLSGEHRKLPVDTLWRGMLRSGFSQRRKKLLKNLRGFHPALPWQDFFEQAGIGENSRAEELSALQWLELRRCAEEKKGLFPV